MMEFKTWENSRCLGILLIPRQDDVLPDLELPVVNLSRMRTKEMPVGLLHLLGLDWFLVPPPLIITNVVSGGLGGRLPASTL